MSKQNINIIAAMSVNRGIGYKNKLPWHFKKELQYFRKKTTACGVRSLNAVIMGRNTFNSIPNVLPGRVNYVISRTLSGPYIFSSIEDCLAECRVFNYENVWIIGGSELYNYALDKNIADKLYLTVIGKEYECDTFFPEIPKNFQLEKVCWDVEDFVELRYEVYRNELSER